MSLSNSKTFQKAEGDLGGIDQSKTKTSCSGGGCSHKTGHIQRLKDNRDNLLTVQQLADLLQYSRHTVYVWMCKSQLPIPYYKFPRGVRFKRSDVDEWIESRKVMPVIHA
jgi:excisionase family DNA binding protein